MSHETQAQDPRALAREALARSERATRGECIHCGCDHFVEDLDFQGKSTCPDCGDDPDDNDYTLRSDVPALARALLAALDALEWALDEGGFDLWWYAETPPPPIVKRGAVGEPARLDWSALLAPSGPEAARDPEVTDA